MALSLENFITSHSAVTLSYSDYGLHFHLGQGVNILTTPSQCLRSFVENDGTPEGSPYRFIVIGRLASFKIVEDSVSLFCLRVLNKRLTHRRIEFGHFLSVHLGQLQPSSAFTEVFRRQIVSLQKIEEEDGTNVRLHTQVEFPLCKTTLGVSLISPSAVFALAIFEGPFSLQGIQCGRPPFVFNRHWWFCVSNCRASMPGRCA
jgi:hypothetical protein